MTTINDIMNAFGIVAPLKLAEDFDNAGLLVGDPSCSVDKVLVALDITQSVIEEAIELSCGLIVSHHPLFFKLGKTINPGVCPEGKLFSLLENKIAAICMHTNMDIAKSGVNDMLIEKIGLAPCGSFSVVDDSLESYIGRLGKTNAPMSAVEFAKQVKLSLGCDGVKVLDAGKAVNVVGVVGGAGGGMAKEAQDAGCDTYVTSEVKHHQFIEALELGINLIDAGHYYTERFITDRFEEILSKFDTLKVFRSKTLDSDIVKVV